MPEVTPDATIILATSWQALGRAETGDERASICNCTLTIVFAAFFIEANFNHFTEKASGKLPIGQPPGEHDALTTKLRWIYNSCIAKEPTSDQVELRSKLEAEFPGFHEIRDFRNDVAHGLINREVANFGNIRRLRLAARAIVERLLEVAQDNDIVIERGVDYEMAISSAPAKSADA